MCSAQRCTWNEAAVLPREAGGQRITVTPDRFREFLASHPECNVNDTPRRDSRRRVLRLDDSRHVYLDYTGGGLYADVAGARARRAARASVLRQPAFRQPRVLEATTTLVERARRAVLDWFNRRLTTTRRSSRSTRPVRSSTSASRIRSPPGGRLLLTVDNHNSVNGIREFAVRERRRGRRTRR